MPWLRLPSRVREGNLRRHILYLCDLVSPGAQGALQAGPKEGGEAGAKDKVQEGSGQAMPGLPNQRPAQGVQGIP